MKRSIGEDPPLKANRILPMSSGRAHDRHQDPPLPGASIPLSGCRVSFVARWKLYSMRLLLVISSLEPGGAERVLSTLANAWSERGHQVTLVTDGPTSADHYPLHPKVRRLSLNALSDSTGIFEKIGRNLVRLKRLRSALVDCAPDVVVAFGSTVNVRAVLACRSLGVPVLISERVDPREFPLPWAWRALRRLSYPMADLLVVQTRSVGEWAKHWISADSIRSIAESHSSARVDLPQATCACRSSYRGRGRTLGAAEGL